MNTKLEQSIAILVDVLVCIHRECKSYDRLSAAWHTRTCSSIALMHIFRDKFGIDPLMSVLAKANDNIGETLVLDQKKLRTLVDTGCKVTKVRSVIGYTKCD